VRRLASVARDAARWARAGVRRALLLRDLTTPCGWRRFQRQVVGGDRKGAGALAGERCQGKCPAPDARARAFAAVSEAGRRANAADERTCGMRAGPSLAPHTRRRMTGKASMSSRGPRSALLCCARARTRARETHEWAADGRMGADAHLHACPGTCCVCLCVPCARAAGNGGRGSINIYTHIYIYVYIHMYINIVYICRYIHLGTEDFPLVTPMCIYIVFS